MNIVCPQRVPTRLAQGGRKAGRARASNMEKKMDSSSPKAPKATVGAPKLPRRSMGDVRRERFGELPLDYPELGFFPTPALMPSDPKVLEKNQEIELIHGRWAMLAVTGAYCQEVAGKGPWFNAGALCTPSDCSAIAFPGPAGPDAFNLAPGQAAFPSFWAVVAFQVVAMGLSELYRTGVISPAFSEFPVGNPYPGGRFDPLGITSPRGTRAASTDDFSLDTLKTQEVKHSRLAMLAWLGIMVQGVATNIDSLTTTGKAVNGPVANLMFHLEDPYGHTIFSVLGNSFSDLHK